MNTDKTKLEAEKSKKCIQEANKVSFNTVLTDEVCYHRPQDRVRTHRGYHCNKCGKRF